jgi:hypothetical protein
MHKWSGAGYLCCVCGGIKDATAEPTCPGKPRVTLRKKKEVGETILPSAVWETQDGRYEVWQEPYPPHRWYVNEQPDNDSTEIAEGFATRREAAEWLKSECYK